MTVSKDIALNVVASVADYQREIAKLPGMTEAAAKKAALAMQKELVKAETTAAASAQRVFTQATAGSVSGLKSIESGAGKAKEALSRMAGAAAQLSPELSSVAGAGTSAFQALSSVAGGGFAGPIGVVSAAVALMGLAWRDAKEDLDKAEASMRAAAAAATAMKNAVDKVNDATDLADLELAVALGEKSAQVLDERTAAAKAEAVFADERATFEERRFNTLKQIQETQEKISKGGTFEEIDRLGKSQDGLRASLALQEKQIKAVDEKQADYTVTLIEAKLQTDANAEATKQAEDAQRKKEKADADAARTQEAATAKAEAWRRALDVSEQTEAVVKFREELTEIGRLQSAPGGLGEAEANEARRLAAEEFAETQNKLNEERIAKESALQKQVDDDRRKAAEELRDVEQQHLEMLASAADVADQYAGTVSSSLDLIIEGQVRQGKGVKALFLAQKAASISEIAINTAIGVAKANAMYLSNPLTAPLAPFAIGAIIAAGAAQTATVAAQPPPEPPTFHSGGSLPQAYLQPDERMVKITKRETVLTDRQARTMPAQGAVNVVHQYRNRVFDSFVQDNWTRGGPLYRLSRQSTRVGHRVR